MTFFYLLLAVVWIAVSVFLGLYITGSGLTARLHYRIGLRTIFAMYLLGICLLFAAVVFV